MMSTHLMNSTDLCTSDVAQGKECAVSYQSAEGNGMHQMITIQLNSSFIIPNNISDGKHCYDLYVSLQSSSGLFIDQYELQNRHDFGWKMVNIYVHRDDVPYEYISTDTDADNFYGIEFLRVPCSPTDGEAGGGVVENTGKCNFSFSWKLPIHMQYHSARKGGGFVFKHFNVTAAHIRPVFCENGPTIVKRFYRETFLFKTGNFDEHRDPFNINSSYQQICVGNENRSLLLKMPLGNGEDLAWVELSTIVVITVVIIFVVRVFTRS